MNMANTIALLLGGAFWLVLIGGMAYRLLRDRVTRKKEGPRADPTQTRQHLRKFHPPRRLGTAAHYQLYAGMPNTGEGSDV